MSDYEDPYDLIATLRADLARVTAERDQLVRSRDAGIERENMALTQLAVERARCERLARVARLAAYANCCEGDDAHWTPEMLVARDSLEPGDIDPKGGST